MCLKAAPRYELTSGIEDVYQLVWEMDYEGAKSAVANVKSEDPSNLLIHLVEDYIDFTRIFLADDMEGYEQYRDDVEKRLSMIKASGAISPYYYYSQAEIYIHWSLVRAKKGETIRAGWDINRAYKLLKKSKEKYPDFKHVDKSLSVIHALMGSIKGFRKTFIKLFTSLDGSIEQGIEEIEELYNWDRSNQSMWSDEIAAVQSLMLGHIQKDWDGALKVLEGVSDEKTNSPIGKYLIASTAYRAGQNDRSIALLMNEEQGGFHTFPQLNFLTANALLYKGDQQAVEYYKKFIDETKGQNYLKSAHQKLAWCSLIFSDSQEDYKRWMTTIPQLGALMIGEDQQAHHAALSDVVPNKVLLQARLLYDGGYDKEALQAIELFEERTNSSADKLEFVYRRARIHQRLGDVDQAIASYRQAINIGSKEKRYYACNSAVQLAQIYFKKGDIIQTKYYVDQALNMKPSERRDDLHHEAELIRDRIKEN